MSAAPTPLQAKRAGEEALAAVDRGDAEALSNAGAAALWVAEAIAGRAARDGGLGLASRAIASDKGASLAALLANPWFVAGKLGPSGAERELWAAAGQEAVGQRAGSCAAALCSLSQEFAWAMAAKCSAKRIASRAKEGAWAAGYAKCVAAAIAWGEPKPGSAGEADLAILGGAAGSWQPGAGDAAEAACMDAVERMLEWGRATPACAHAALATAARPGASQGRAIGLAMLAAEQAGVSLGAISPEVFGEKSGKTKMRGGSAHAESAPAVSFGQRLDPCWAAAALCAGPESAQAAIRLSKDLGGDPGGQPMLEPNLAGLAHPLDKVWEVWSHSQRAGFALPKKPIEVAKRAFEAAIGAWSGRVEPSLMEEWRSAGEKVLSDLLSGAVPGSFPGWSRRPSAKEQSDRLCARLSPMAWASRRGIGEQGFVAVALAQDALGFELEASLRQARDVCGFEPDGEWVAAAQKALLGSVAPSAGAPARAPLRM